MIVVILLLQTLAYLANMSATNGDHYSVYCDDKMTFCQIERESPNQDHATTLYRRYPIECVNGEWQQVNRSGVLSGSDQVFDVGPFNPSTTTWNDCPTTTNNHYRR